MFRNLVRIQPRSDHLYVAQNRTVLAMNRDGFFDGHSDRGLFVNETRLLSRLQYRINGQSPEPNVLSNVRQHTWMGYYIVGQPKAGQAEKTDSSKKCLELRVSRFAGAGVHEDLDLANFTQEKTRVTLELDYDADFADVQETSGERQQKGEQTREWREAGPGAWELVFDYHANHHYDVQGEVGNASIHRSLTLRFHHADSAPRQEGTRILFEMELEPLGRWHACLDYIPTMDGNRLEPQYRCRAFHGDRDAPFDRLRRTFLREATRIRTPGSGTLSGVVEGALEQAKQDLAALRLYDLDHNPHSWTLAAGLPIYIALFGRDTMTAAWQAALLGPEMLRGTLAELPRWQARNTDDWRDEQPGRMLHEAHMGPLSALNYIPQGRYYGSMTTAGFYPAALVELWHWTGDRESAKSLLRPALDALRWMDRFGDPNRDGFYEYQRRSEHGVKNQVWKDSDDAIVYEDGGIVPDPISSCDTQALVYGAKMFLCEMLWWLEERDTAQRLFQEARELKQRFNDKFWMEREGTFAMALDPDRRQVRSIGSDPGHAVAAGIVDQERVLPTVGRLVADDLFSGWGIRTLSALHPAYNPYSYHRGSVWPAEQGLFAMGFLRYGLYGHVELLARALFEAAALFDFCRLPEVFSGHPRDAGHPFPALYPQANTPQAWSASAVFCCLQALLGLYPYAPLGVLGVDPHLPEWLPEITLEGLRVGKAAVTIRFYRKPDGNSDYRIEDLRGKLRVVRQPSPWSLTAGWGERIEDLLTSYEH